MKSVTPQSQGSVGSPNSLTVPKRSLSTAHHLGSKDKESRQSQQNKSQEKGKGGPFLSSSDISSILSAVSDDGRDSPSFSPVRKGVWVSTCRREQMQFVCSLSVCLSVYLTVFLSLYAGSNNRRRSDRKDSDPQDIDSPFSTLKRSTYILPVQYN